MTDYGGVSVLVPTPNKAKTIGEVKEKLHDIGIAHVFAVDDHMTDDTQEIARDHDAEVIEQTDPVWARPSDMASVKLTQPSS